MKNNKEQLPSRERMKKIILSTVKDKTWSRRELISKVIKRCGFTPEQLKDTSTDSISTRLKSFAGTVINELVGEKALSLTQDNKIELPPKKKLENKEILEVFINKYLTDEEKKDRTPGGKRNTLNAVLGNILKKKKKEIDKADDVVEYLDKQLINNSTVYEKIIKHSDYPETPLGNKLRFLNEKFNECKRGALPKENYRKILNQSVLECLSLAGGEFFERLCLSLIKKGYGDRVVNDKLTAGPDDKGIDGIVYIKDEMGFDERVFIQAKTKRKKGYIPLCEIREFLGVMIAEKATKGILISNSNYHKETIKFADKVDNLILINQKKLLELMQKHSIGIIQQNGLCKIDDKLFLEQV
ncbi:MAG: restriction endonuclease [Bacillota bacterium]|jgi:restriction endonuclease Mrr|nr:restriction endonuclease [Bacillota bacterium]HHU43397.1 restriction endonuclease [Clostridiales bacterium]